MNVLRMLSARVAAWCFGPTEDAPENYPIIAQPPTPSLVRRRDLGARFLPRIDVAPCPRYERCACANCRAKRLVLRLFAAPPN